MIKKFSNKGYLQISFAWLFAIFAGAIILFLAVFIAGRIWDIGETEAGAEAAKGIEVILNPIETNIESGRAYRGRGHRW